MHEDLRFRCLCMYVSATHIRYEAIIPTFSSHVGNKGSVDNSNKCKCKLISLSDEGLEGGVCAHVYLYIHTRYVSESFVRCWDVGICWKTLSDHNLIWFRGILYTLLGSFRSHMHICIRYFLKIINFTQKKTSCILI